MPYQTIVLPTVTIAMPCGGAAEAKAIIRLWGGQKGSDATAGALMTFGTGPVFEWLRNHQYMIEWWVRVKLNRSNPGVIDLTIAFANNTLRQGFIDANGGSGNA